MNGLVNFFVYRVKNGLKKWTEVPALWQDKVKTELESEGYTINADGTVSKNSDNA